MANSIRLLVEMRVCRFVIPFPHIPHVGYGPDLPASRSYPALLCFPEAWDSGLMGNGAWNYVPDVSNLHNWIHAE